MTSLSIHPASFKDPSGFIFIINDTVYRQINNSYTEDFNHLMNSGLYQALTKRKLLVSHKEIKENLTGTVDWYTTVQPEKIEFITYPYEWSFEQLKDAALLTLQTLLISIEHGMILKDATPLNIQFHKGRPIFIDTLSFELYNEQQPWVAYRQFCENFLFPLYLEYYLKTGVQPLQRAYPEGIPASLAAKMLPFKSRFKLATWLHILLQRSVGGKASSANHYQAQFSKQKLLNLIQHLQQTITALQASTSLRTTWSHYYEETILDQAYLQKKEQLFLELLNSVEVSTALDLGANDGHFSKLMAEQKIQVVATDFDSTCINNLYQHCKKNNNTYILPLVQDISNPSAASGFANTERDRFDERIQVQMVTALALIHHLVIGKNIPLPKVAQYLHSIAPILLIEFVPKSDPKVKQMLSNRKDVFTEYDEAHFESYFSTYYTIEDKKSIPGTTRTLYKMQRIEAL